MGLWLLQGDAVAAGYAEVIDIVLALHRTSSKIGVELSLEMRDILSIPVKC